MNMKYLMAILFALGVTFFGAVNAETAKEELKNATPEEKAAAQKANESLTAEQREAGKEKWKSMSEEEQKAAKKKAREMHGEKTESK